MLHPVGSQPSSVYWRRRLLVIASFVLLIVLVVLTVQAVTAGSGGAPSAAGAGATTSAQRTSARPTSATTPKPSPSSTASTGRSSSASSKQQPPSRTRAVPPPRCQARDLAVSSVVGNATYSVGDKPMVELQVTDTGTTPCVQDLADSQVELRVYNGESRVWGSHDCEIQPGTNDRTLAVGRAVRVSITWSGYTSEPKCAGTRQRVGAGTYTLYALLAGRTGRATQFAIS